MEEKTIFKASRNGLLHGLQRVSKVLPRKSTVPILQYIYVKVSTAGKTLTLVGSDRENQLTSVVDIVEASNDMEFCVDKMIIDLLLTLPEQPVVFEVSKKTVIDGLKKSVSVDVVLEHSGGRLTISGEDAALYSVSNPQSVNSFDVPTEKLIRGLEMAKNFSLDDVEFQPILSGVYVDMKEEGITFVSCDKHRLSRFTDRSLSGITGEGFVILNSSVNTLCSILDGDSVTVDLSSNSISFRFGNTVLISRRVEGKYPNYNSLFPRSPIKVSVEKELILPAVKRLLNIANTASAAIRMEVEFEQIKLTAEDIDFRRSGKESVAAVANESITIGINGQRLATLLSVVRGDVILELSDPSRAVLLSPEKQEESTELTLLMMPIFLTQ